MTKLSLWFLPLLFVTTSALSAQETTKSPVDSVNPYIGTAGPGSDYGGTMPLVTTPFGMTNWTAQTRQNKISVSSYNYGDTTISGFIGTHQPAIWMGDYGYIVLMPEVGELRTSPDSRRLAFSHSDETARPDYYAVSLRTENGARIHTEMTATERCAYLRFRFPDAGAARVLVEISRPGIAGSA